MKRIDELTFLLTKDVDALYRYGDGPLMSIHSIVKILIDECKTDDEIKDIIITIIEKRTQRERARVSKWKRSRQKPTIHKSIDPRFFFDNEKL